MANSTRDPRSEAEKAIADLKRNAEMDMSLTESPLERQPSVTPDTFGVHDKPARLRSGHDQGVEAGGKLPNRRARSSRIGAEHSIARRAWRWPLPTGTWPNAAGRCRVARAICWSSSA